MFLHQSLNILIKAVKDFGGITGGDAPAWIYLRYASAGGVDLFVFLMMWRATGLGLCPDAAYWRLSKLYLWQQ